MAVHYATELLPVIQLKGECNRCGLCCSGIQDGKAWACEHLQLTPGVPFGTPGASKCRVYERRVNGMVITVYFCNGDRAMSQCFKDSLQETEIILTHIGKGCSLTVGPPKEG